MYGRVSPVQRGIIPSTPSAFTPRICELSHVLLAKVLIAREKSNGHKGEFLSGFTLGPGGCLFANTHPGCAQGPTHRAPFTSRSHLLQFCNLGSLLTFFRCSRVWGKFVGLKGAEEPTWDPRTAITNLQAKARGTGCHLQPSLVTVTPVGIPSAPSPKCHPGRCPLCRSQCHQMVAKLEASLAASFAVS